MQEKLQELRAFIHNCYGIDIYDAERRFTPHCYVFHFSDKPYMIRVGYNDGETRKEALSEVLWIDDLSLFSENICVPTPSKKGNLIEEFQLGDTMYRVSMYQTAGGRVCNIADWNVDYFTAVGECLGKIHALSVKANQDGFRYKRKHWSEMFVSSTTQLPLDEKFISDELCSRIDGILTQIKAIPEDPRWFGMIHGDFHSTNFFVDENRILLFNFGLCCYGHFMYDIVSVCSFWLQYGYPFDQKKSRRQALYEDILPYFKKGYTQHMDFPNEHWELLELFLAYRICACLGSVYKSFVSGEAKGLETILEMFCKVLSYPDVLEGIDVIIEDTKKLETQFQ